MDDKEPDEDGDDEKAKDKAKKDKELGPFFDKIEDWDEQYHSKHGAIQEAQHVFIKEGLQHFFEFKKKGKMVYVFSSFFLDSKNKYPKTLNINPGC